MKSKKRDRDTLEEHHVITEAEVGATHLPTKNAQGFQKPPEAETEAWNKFSSESREESNPADTLILDY